MSVTACAQRQKCCLPRLLAPSKSHFVLTSRFARTVDVVFGFTVRLAPNAEQDRSGRVPLLPFPRLGHLARHGGGVIPEAAESNPSCSVSWASAIILVESVGSNTRPPGRPKRMTSDGGSVITGLEDPAELGVGGVQLKNFWWKLRASAEMSRYWNISGWEVFCRPRGRNDPRGAALVG